MSIRKNISNPLDLNQKGHKLKKISEKSASPGIIPDFEDLLIYPKMTNPDPKAPEMGFGIRDPGKISSRFKNDSNLFRCAALLLISLSKRLQVGVNLILRRPNETKSFIKIKCIVQ